MTYLYLSLQLPQAIRQVLAIPRRLQRFLGFSSTHLQSVIFTVPVSRSTTLNFSGESFQVEHVSHVMGHVSLTPFLLQRLDLADTHSPHVLNLILFLLLVRIPTFKGESLHSINDGVKGIVKSFTEGVVESSTEGVVESSTEGTIEGSSEGAIEGCDERIRGTIEGFTEGIVEGFTEGTVEGSIEDANDRPHFSSPNKVLSEKPKSHPSRIRPPPNRIV
jgi:hypothetical protein